MRQDLISRCELFNRLATVQTLGEAYAVIQDMPTEPERKKGRWTKAYDGNDDHVKCTGCFKTYDWISQAQYYNYCPNCGAKMEAEA